MKGLSERLRRMLKVWLRLNLNDFGRVERVERFGFCLKFLSQVIERI